MGRLHCFSYKFDALIAKLSIIASSTVLEARFGLYVIISYSILICFMSGYLVLEYILLTKFNFQWWVHDLIDCFSLLSNSITSFYFTCFHLVSFLLTKNGLKLVSCHQVQQKSNLVTGIFIQDSNTNIIFFIYFLRYFLLKFYNLYNVLLVLLFFPCPS